jgi:hypothetical protein
VRRADPPSKESYPLFKKDYATEEVTTAQQSAVEPLMNEWMNENIWLFTFVDARREDKKILHIFLKKF